MQNVELRILVVREYVDKYDDHEDCWYRVPIISEPVLQYKNSDQEWQDVPTVIVDV